MLLLAENGLDPDDGGPRPERIVVVSAGRVGGSYQHAYRLHYSLNRAPSVLLPTIHPVCQAC